MEKKSSVLALSAILSAVSAVMILLASVLPSGRIAVTALAGCACAAAVIHIGLKRSIAVFAVSAALALLISPTKSCAVLYVLFFGWYPITKSPIEHIGGIVPCWAAKIAVFNAALAVVWIGFFEIVSEGISFPKAGIVPAVAGCNIIFVLYDLCLSRLIAAYIGQVSKHINK